MDLRRRPISYSVAPSKDTEILAPGTSDPRKRETDKTLHSSAAQESGASDSWKNSKKSTSAPSSSQGKNASVHPDGTKSLNASPVKLVRIHTEASRVIATPPSPLITEAPYSPYSPLLSPQKSSTTSKETRLSSPVRSTNPSTSHFGSYSSSTVHSSSHAHRTNSASYEDRYRREAMHDHQGDSRDSYRGRREEYRSSGQRNDYYDDERKNRQEKDRRMKSDDRYDRLHSNDERTNPNFADISRELRENSWRRSYDDQRFHREDFRDRPRSSLEYEYGTYTDGPVLSSRRRDDDYERNYPENIETKKTGHSKKETNYVSSSSSDVSLRLNNSKPVIESTSSSTGATSLNRNPSVNSSSTVPVVPLSSSKPDDKQEKVVVEPSFYIDEQFIPSLLNLFAKEYVSMLKCIQYKTKKPRKMRFYRDMVKRVEDFSGNKLKIHISNNHGEVLVDEREWLNIKNPSTMSVYHLILEKIYFESQGWKILIEETKKEGGELVQSSHAKDEAFHRVWKSIDRLKETNQSAIANVQTSNNNNNNNNNNQNHTHTHNHNSQGLNRQLIHSNTCGEHRCVFVIGKIQLGVGVGINREGAYHQASVNAWDGLVKIANTQSNR
jgi:hypothetical protein